MPSMWSKLGGEWLGRDPRAMGMRKQPRRYGDRSEKPMTVDIYDPSGANQEVRNVSLPQAVEEWQAAASPSDLGAMPDGLGTDYKSSGIDVSTEIPPTDIQLERKAAPMVAATDIQLRAKKLTPEQVRERSQILYSLMHKAVRSDTLASMPKDNTIDDKEMEAWMAGKKAPGKTMVPFARMSPSYRDALSRAAQAEGLKGEAYGWDLSNLTPQEQAVLQSSMRDEFRAAQQRKMEAQQQLYAGDPVVR